MSFHRRMTKTLPCSCQQRSCHRTASCNRMVVVVQYYDELSELRCSALVFQCKRECSSRRRMRAGPHRSKCRRRILVEEPLRRSKYRKSDRTCSWPMDQRSRHQPKCDNRLEASLSISVMKCWRAMWSVGESIQNKRRRNRIGRIDRRWYRRTSRLDSGT